MKNKLLYTAIALMAFPAMVSAQSAIDIYNLSQSEVRGTARFMSMGGAFTALGGDLSSLTQNPAGIGVYRRSEIGATLDISPRSITANTDYYSTKVSSTPVACNNFGYVGTVLLDGAMQTFSWGATYNRIASFNRKFSAYNGSTNTSLSNYIASFTTGVPQSDMLFDSNYNPYFDSDIDWLSILAYNTYMINPTGGSKYNGLFQDGRSNGDAITEMRESGYADEYTIDFGGNVNDVVMWGIGFGITDLKYNRTAYYSESMDNAFCETTSSGMITNGNAGFDLTNYRSINGTGFNLKVGLIFKPVNELRIGVAFHTPTWYTFTSNGYGEVDYSYFNPNQDESKTNPMAGYEYTDNAIYNFRMTSPWKLMVGVAGVIGTSAIISADYEFQAYNKMRTSYQAHFGDYASNNWVNEDIQDYFKAANIFRLGFEYRITPNFSARAGYNFTSTTATDYALNGGEILTAGTDPSFTLNRGINAVSAGLGYRYQSFYVDAAYVYRNKKSTFKAFTDFNGYEAPTASLNENTNSIVLSVGFKF